MKFPHTLTNEQSAIISVALDNAREREADYIARHKDRPDDHLRALDELRKLWAFSGLIVLNALKRDNYDSHPDDCRCAYHDGNG